MLPWNFCVFMESVNILKEAEKASYQAMQMAMETQAANVPVTQVPVPEIASADIMMDVDAAPRERGTKRGADDSQDGNEHKKSRIGEFPL